MGSHHIKCKVERPLTLMGAAGAALVMSSAVLCAQTVVGGVTPSQRPAGAPQIESITRDAAWFRRALTGVSMPHPPSLRFLESQGEWHTPFTRAGMIGPYDIRRWHQATR
jgi:hypothetical protein